MSKFIMNSDSITAYMNNKANTCTFKVIDTKIDVNTPIELWEGATITSQASSGQPSIVVNDTFQDCNKFRVGDILYIDPHGAVEQRLIIDSIDHSTKTITFTTNLANVVPAQTIVGKKYFSGSVIKNPDSEYAYDGKFEYRISAVDDTKFFDRKNVNETYTDQYPREILGRVVYEFCANDSELQILSFDSSLTNGGVARALSSETTDRIQGTASQKGGATGAGTGTYSATFAAKDLSSYTKARFWWKVTTGNGAALTAMQLRLGTNSSNVFVYNVDNIGELFEDCWNLESCILDLPDSVVGSPNMSSITYVEINFTASSSIAAGQLLFDELMAFTGGFTIQNTVRGIRKFTNFPVSQKKPTLVLDTLAKNLSSFWRIDYDRDIHYFSDISTESAPFSITDTSENYNDLELEVDVSHLKNRQVVRGKEVPATSLLTQQKVADGVEEQFRLHYKPDSLEIFVNTGSGFVAKTVGVENLTDPTTVDYVYNFNEKTVKRASAAVLSAGHIIKFTYYPYQPIRVQVSDPVSIAAMKALTGGDGIVDGAVITDLNLKSFEEARARGNAELAAYRNGEVNISFETYQDGLEAGQIIRITDSSRGIDDTYLIQQVKRKAVQGARAKYSVDVASSLFGIIEFFQLLLKRSEAEVTQNEAVDILLNPDEIINFADIYNFTIKTKTFQSGDKDVRKWDFTDITGSLSGSSGLLSTWWYGAFTAEPSGTVSIDLSTRHNNGRAMKVVTTVGGTGKEIRVKQTKRLPINPSTEYTLSAWIEQLAALTNSSSGVVFVELFTYQNKIGGSALDSIQITSSPLNVGFKKYSDVFTTNVNANYFEIQMGIYQGIGTASFADILLEETATETSSNPAYADFSQSS